MILWNDGNGVISGEKALKLVGLDDEIDVFVAKEQEKKDFQAQQFKLQMQNEKTQQALNDKQQTDQKQQQQKHSNLIQNFKDEQKRLLDLKLKSASIQEKDLQTKEELYRKLMDKLEEI
jgi:hypothetical protein